MQRGETGSLWLPPRTCIPAGLRGPYDALMDAGAATGGERPPGLQQAVKWTVYTLLIINFGFYVLEDWSRAVHTLHAGYGFLDWTGAFATSIDESAWFLLLFMFELETYVLEDRPWTARVMRVVHGIRLLCYLMIAHTVFAYAIAAFELQATVPVDNVQGLCELADADVSYVYNLEYTEVNHRNCGDLSQASRFYWLGENAVVSDGAGLELERTLAWVDLADAVIWLMILLAIETVVRLQGRGVAGGPVIAAVNTLKIALYLALVAFAFYWGSLSHWLYFWDELLWIGGFAAIEVNVSDWRRELRGRQARGAPA